MEGGWWNSEIPFELGPKVGLSFEPSSIDVKEATYVYHRKDLDNITLQQQRVRLSSVLDSIRVLAEIENTSQVKIAALALQSLPALHKVLAHSEELLRDLNSGFGLKCFSEEGSEACNKLIRKYRENVFRR